MKYMGLDVGDRTIGIAFSDPLGKIATPAENYRRVSNKEDVDHLVDLIVSREVGQVVIGLPYNMDGSIGPQGEKTISFGKKLIKKLTYSDRLSREVPCTYWDERLTSKSAEAALIQMDMRREKRKQHIDMVAATIILQHYLDSLKEEK